jgi:hypothetical protein
MIGHEMSLLNPQGVGIRTDCDDTSRRAAIVEFVTGMLKIEY